MKASIVTIWRHHAEPDLCRSYRTHDDTYTLGSCLEFLFSLAFSTTDLVVLCVLLCHLYTGHRRIQDIKTRRDLKDMKREWSQKDNAYEDKERVERDRDRDRQRGTCKLSKPWSFPRSRARSALRASRSFCLASVSCSYFSIHMSSYGEV